LSLATDIDHNLNLVNYKLSSSHSLTDCFQIHLSAFGDNANIVHTTQQNIQNRTTASLYLGNFQQTGRRQKLENVH